MTWGTNIATTERNVAQNVSPGRSDWDIVELGGNVLPGVAKVKVRAPSGLDVQKPEGSKRATVRDNGDQLVEVSISLEIQPDEFEEFRDFVMPDLKPPGKNKGRDPLTIIHPACEAFGISSVIVDIIDMGHPKSGGTMIVGIECFEWAASTATAKTTGKVKQSGGDWPGPYESEPDFVDPWTNVDDVIFLAGGG